MPEYGSWVYPAKSLVSRCRRPEAGRRTLPRPSLTPSLVPSLQYSRGSLLSIDQFSPTQFDRVEIILSSNEAGVFNVEVVFTPPGHTKTTVDKASVTMHEVRPPPSPSCAHQRADASLPLAASQLLQRQRDNTESIRLGLSDFSVNLFIAQLNKSACLLPRARAAADLR